VQYEKQWEGKDVIEFGIEIDLSEIQLKKHFSPIWVIVEGRLILVIRLQFWKVLFSSFVVDPWIVICLIFLLRMMMLPSSSLRSSFNMLRFL
jgi:hypothetical protein